MNAPCNTPLDLFYTYFIPEKVSERCSYLGLLPVTPTAFHAAIYLGAFGLTLLLEFPFYFFALGKMPFRRKLMVLLLANLATHPAIYFLFPWLGSLLNVNYQNYLLFAEVFVPLVEAFLIIKFWKVPIVKGLFWMLLANLASWWIGAYR